MSVGIDLPAALPSFDKTAKVAIARLNPSVDGVAQSHVEATVALIWPYSSSTQQLSLLLVDQDIRLRKSKGQVKVTFNGDCAREVAKTHVGIGNSIRLGLENVTWTKTGEEVSTPGKKVDWDIVVNKRAKVEVQKEDGSTVAIDIVAQPPPPQTVNDSVVEIEGPYANGFIDIRKPLLSGSHFSPTRNTSHRVSSGSFIDATLDPFAEHDGYITGRARKRTKFLRHSGSWRLLSAEEEPFNDVEGRIPSAELPQDIPAANQETVHEVGHHEGTSTPSAMTGDLLIQEATTQTEPDLAETIHTNGIAAVTTPESPLSVYSKAPLAVDTAMALPATPNPPTPEDRIVPRLLIEDLTTAALTPLIRPLASPGLALVSPLIQRSGTSTGYFPVLAHPDSELDVISHVAQDSQSLLEQSSVVSRTEPSDSLHVQGANLDTLLVNDLDGLTEPVISSSADDILGSGQIPEISGDIAMPDSFHDPVMNALSVSTDGVVDSSLPYNFVDLDALQQHIQDASDLSQAPISQRQTEDDDMYGPHLVQLIQPQVVGLSQEVEGFPMNETSPRSPKQSQHEMVPMATLDGSPQQASSQMQTDTAEQALIDAVVTITASDDDDDEELGKVTRQDSETDASDTADESGTSDLEEDLVKDDSADDTTTSNHLEGNELTDLEEALGRELGGEELQRDVSDIVDVEEPSQALIKPPNISEVQAAVTRSILASPEESIMDNTQHERSTERTNDEGLFQTDGMLESYESQAERDRIRIQMIAKEAIDRSQSINLISSSPKLPSFGIDEQEPMDSDAIDTDGASVAINVTTKEDSIPSATAREGKTNSNDGSEVDTTTLETSISVKEPLHSRRRDVALSHLITPESTQQVATTIEHTSPLETAPLPTLPLSPILTQEQPELESTTYPTTHALHHDQPTSENEPSLPELTTEPDIPSDSHRLSKRYFTSELISTEYFTPRRSLPLRQHSPPLESTPFPTIQQPSSPTRTRRILRSSSPAIIRQAEEGKVQSGKMTRGTTTPLSYYPRLSMLHEHFNQQVDVMAVCPIESSPAKEARSGPKDTYTTVCLTDSSLGQNNTSVRAQIFRPKRKALPTTESGDIILLQSMKVQAHKHQVMLVSTNSSSWAVLKQTTKGAFDIVTTGPPVEYGDAELTEAARLSQWWSQEGSTKFEAAPELASQNDGQSTSLSTSPMLTRSQRRRANTTDNSSNAHEIDQTERPNNSSPPPMLELQQSVSQGELPSPTATHKQRRHRRADSERSESVVHELRDGTTYINNDNHAGRRNSVVHELRDGSTYIDE